MKTIHNIDHLNENTKLSPKIIATNYRGHSICQRSNERLLAYIRAYATCFTLSTSSWELHGKWLRWFGFVNFLWGRTQINVAIDWFFFRQTGFIHKTGRSDLATGNNNDALKVKLRNRFHHLHFNLRLFLVACYCTATFLKSPIAFSSH